MSVERLDVAGQVAVQLPAVVFRGVEPREALDDGPRFGDFIDPLGLRAGHVAVRAAISVFLICSDQPHGGLERGGVQDNAFLHVFVKRLDELQRATDRDAKRVDARLESL